jgi:hypothetical protein
MNRRHDRTFAHSETGLEEAVLSAGGDRQAAIGAVAEEVARDLGKSDHVGAALLSTISAVAFSAAQAAVQTGGEMGCVAQGFLMGVIVVGAAREHNLLALIGHAAGSFIKHVHEARGDAAAAARGLVAAVVSPARALMLDADEAARAAALGAVEAADEVSHGLGRAVRVALEEPIGGFTVLAPKPASTGGSPPLPR